MHFRRILPVSFTLLALFASTAAGQSRPTLELPEYTEQQRWERAAMHVSLFSVTTLWQGAQHGKTAEEVGTEMAVLVGPGWSGITTPEAMARAIHRNWSIWPASEFELLSGSDGTVTFRVNRPYANVFDEDGMSYGIALGDMDIMFETFHQHVAEQQGLQYSQTGDEEGLTITIRQR